MHTWVNACIHICSWEIRQKFFCTRGKKWGVAYGKMINLICVTEIQVLTTVAYNMFTKLAKILILTLPKITGTYCKSFIHTSNESISWCNS